VAHQVAPIYRQTLELRKQVAASTLDAEAKLVCCLNWTRRLTRFRPRLRICLGLTLSFYNEADNAQSGGSFRGGSADEMPRSVTPGEEFKVHVHAAQATAETTLVAYGWRARAATNGRRML